MSCDLKSGPRSTDTILPVLETRSTATRYDRGDGAAQPTRATCMHIFIRRDGKKLYTESAHKVYTGEYSPLSAFDFRFLESTSR